MGLPHYHRRCHRNYHHALHLALEGTRALHLQPGVPSRQTGASGTSCLGSSIAQPVCSSSFSESRIPSAAISRDQPPRRDSAASHRLCQALEGLTPEGTHVSPPDANQQLSAMRPRCSSLCRPQSRLQQTRFTQIARNSWPEPELQASQGTCVYTGSLQGYLGQ